VKELYRKIIKPQIHDLIRIDESSINRSDYLCLDKNERLFSFNKYFIEDIRKKISSRLLSTYFDLKLTYKKLSEFTDVPVSNLLLTFGADMGIRHIYDTCIREGDHIIIPSLSYAMYKVYAQMFGAKIEVIKINNNWTFSIDEIFSRIRNSTKMVVLESPNGTIGTIYNKEEIKKCSKILFDNNILLLIDETYWAIDDRYESVKDIVNECSNVVIVRSFSKMPGLAGLRVGYLISNKELMGYILRVRPLHEISSFSAIVIESLIENKKNIYEYKKEFNKSKSYLQKNLSELNIEYRDTYANFILIFLPDIGGTKNINNRLREQNVLFKKTFNEEILSGWIRLSIGSISDSKKFIFLLKKMIIEGKK